VASIFDTTNIQDAPTIGQPTPQLTVGGATAGKPIVDTSIGQAVTGALNIGFDIFKEHKKGELREELTELEESTLKSVSNSINQLTSGVSQGTISQLEYKAKKDKILKESINSLPGLTDEFLKIGKTTSSLELPAAFDLQKQLNKQRTKERGEMATRIRTHATSIGLGKQIPPDMSDDDVIATWSSGSMQAILNQEAASGEQADDFLATGVFTRPIALQGINTKVRQAPNAVDSVVGGGLAAHGVGLPAGHLYDVILSLTPQDLEQVGPHIERILDNHFTSNFEGFKVNGNGEVVVDDKTFTSLTKSTRDMYDDIIEMSNVKSGADRKSAIKNTLQSQIDTQILMQTQSALADSEELTTAAIWAKATDGAVMPVELSSSLYGHDSNVLQTIRRHAILPGISSNSKLIKISQDYSSNDKDNPVTVSSAMLLSVGKDLLAGGNKTSKEYEEMLSQSGQAQESWANTALDTQLPINAQANVYRTTTATYEELAKIDPRTAESVKVKTQDGYQNNLNRLVDGMARHWDNDRYEIVPPSAANDYKYEFKNKEGKHTPYNDPNTKALRHIFELINTTVDVETEFNQGAKEQSAGLIGAMLVGTMEQEAGGFTTTEEMVSGIARSRLGVSDTAAHPFEPLINDLKKVGGAVMDFLGEEPEVESVDEFDSQEPSPRGIRNNNPGNIKTTGDKWLGQSDTQGDDTFVQFDNEIFGIRAMGKILQSYSKRGVDTVEEIISTWAPPSENDTEAYIKSVEQSTGLSREDKVDATDGDALAKIISGIIRQENGKEAVPEEDVIRSGVSLVVGEGA
jgi:hypothetical protein